MAAAVAASKPPPAALSAHTRDLTHEASGQDIVAAGHRQRKHRQLSALRVSHEAKALREHRPQHHPDGVGWRGVGGPRLDDEPLRRSPVWSVNQLDVLETVGNKNDLPDDDVAGNDRPPGWNTTRGML